MKKVNLLVQVTMCSLAVSSYNSTQAMDCFKACFGFCCDGEQDIRQPLHRQDGPPYHRIPTEGSGDRSQTDTKEKSKDVRVPGPLIVPPTQISAGAADTSKSGDSRDDNSLTALHASQQSLSSSTQSSSAGDTDSRLSDPSLSTWQKSIIKAGLKERVSEEIWDHLIGAQNANLASALEKAINGLDSSLFLNTTEVVDLAYLGNSKFQLSIGERTHPTFYSF